MKSQLLNQPIQDVINERNLYRIIMAISILIIFFLIICLCIFIENKKELEAALEQLSNSNRSLLENLNPKP